MVRRTWLVAAALLAVLLAVGAWLAWPSAPHEPERVAAPMPVPIAHRSSRTPALVATPAPSPVVSSDEQSPHTAHEEAMFAAIRHSGEGFVRCTLPAGLQVELAGLNWAGQDGDQLTMAAEQPEGTVPLTQMGTSERRFPTPVALARWSDAFPGQEGRCEILLSDDQFDVDIVARLPNGEPAAGARVMGTLGSEETNDEGRARVSVWPGSVQLSVHLDDAEQGNFIGFHSAEVRAAQTITVELEPVLPASPDTILTEFDGEAPDEMLARIAEQQADRHDDPIRAALRDPTLSDGARSQLEAWLDRSASSLDETYELVDAIREASERDDGSRAPWIISGE